MFFYYINKSTNHKCCKFLNATKISIILVFNIVDYGALLWIYNTVHGESAPDLFKVVAILLGLADIAIANFLPKCRQNRWAGIRTKWTLANEEVWEKPIGLVVNCLQLTELYALQFQCLLKELLVYMLFFFGDMIMIMILILYSYLIFQKTGVRNG